MVFLLSLLLLLTPSSADVGTAAYYSTPYTPTVCYGSDTSQLPAYGLFAAAGEGIWDNGASCGREYKVRCLSSEMPRACDTGRTIQITVVDRASKLRSISSRNGATLVLSAAAFEMVANKSAGVINIEFTQV
ncbi:uncharacterized protein A4U43_C01F23870 [Asparagus officinalis]|uniref:Expansin-like EG45 domain-containing protein n=1 Tax=Asparagus officinalis TaxID=4686 RepID=A0A5P1FSH9_ASPOF|nr:EG45-like domain containing protein 2 [Asparagus officinalis]ONK80974.1 uncharacterized protein A4U43_C01F23870 [Asparagus officinalis]